MKNSLPPELPVTDDPHPATGEARSDRGLFTHRLLTASEVAAFVGCHEESVRRAYLCGQLKRPPFRREELPLRSN
jgi:hypothetical protein